MPRDPSPSPARYSAAGFRGLSSDPNALLLTTVRDSDPALATRLDPGLGGSIHSYLLGSLRRARVREPQAAAEGVFQDFLLRVVRRFRNRGAEGLGSGWFRTVAKSALLDRLNKLEAERTMLRELLDGSRAIGKGDFTDTQSDELVHRALAKLPPRQREIILLDQQGLSTEELQKAMGLKKNSIVTLRYEATRALKKEILEEAGRPL